MHLFRAGSGFDHLISGRFFLPLAELHEEKGDRVQEHERYGRNQVHVTGIIGIWFAVQSHDDGITQGKVVTLRAEYGQQSRFGHVHRTRDYEADDEDGEENDRFGQEDRQEEHPVDRIEIERGHWGENHRRQGKSAHEGIQTLGFDFRYHVQFPRNVPGKMIIRLIVVYIVSFVRTYPHRITAKHSIMAG